MSTNTFNTAANQQIAREMLLALLNVADAGQTPDWDPIGYTVPEGSMEYDWGEDTSQDILGITRTTMKKPQVTQSFEGVKLYQGDPAYEKIWVKGIKNQDPQALCNLDIMVVHIYAGDSATPFAERYPQSSVRPTSIGGEGGGFIEMPLEVTYGGARATGTATKDASTGEWTFSEATTTTTTTTTTGN